MSRAAKTPALPSGLPPLPAVPEGWDRWAKPRKGPCDVPSDAPVAMYHDMRQDWGVKTDYWTGNDARSWYAVAVRDPKPAPKLKNSGRFTVAAVVPEQPAKFDAKAALSAEALRRVMRFNAERDKGIPMPEPAQVVSKPAPKKRKGRVVAVRAAAPTYFAKPSELGMGYVVRLNPYRGDVPVLLLPADAASVERMVEQGEAKINALMLREKDWSIEDLARAALAAIGIRAPKKGGSK